MEEQQWGSLWRRRRRQRRVETVPLEAALGWAIFRRRRQLGLTRQRLAAMAEERLAQQGMTEKISYDYIRRLEWGEVDYTSRRKLQAIADVLGLDLEKDVSKEEPSEFPGPEHRRPRDPFSERVRLLRAVEEWLRRCSDQEVVLLKESWPTVAALMSRLAPLVSREERGAEEALTPEHVFEQNRASLWRTPSDIYEWLDRLLTLIEEAVPWRREVRAIREAVLEAMRWHVGERQEGKVKGGQEDGEAEEKE
jgi:transcriptional regulator with XRE-family HTH domain